MARRMRPNSSVLSMAIAHTQTDANSNPIITACTRICACKKRANSERSDEASPTCGKLESMDYPFRVAGQNAEWRRRCGDQGRPERPRGTLRRKPNLRSEIVPVHHRLE